MIGRRKIVFKATSFRKAVLAGCLIAGLGSGSIIFGEVDTQPPASPPPAANTPPMGWNPWNAFRTEVTEAKILAVAQLMKQNGLADAGYRYIDVDDGWWLKRDADHRLVVRTAMFPSAAMPDGTTSLRPFVDRLHAMGLLAGLYTDIGRNVCSQAWDVQSPNLPQGSVAEREVGSMNNQARDMRLIFGVWRFDALKVDACGLADFGSSKAYVRNGTYRELGPYIVRGQVTPMQSARVEALYASLKKQIDTVRPRHDTALAVCTWGEANVQKWGSRYGRSWRTSPDIEPTWKSMLANFDSAEAHSETSGPGHYHDPDMLEIGNGAFDADHLEAARAHLSLWAMLNAPLILGSDITHWSASLVEVAGNREVIALDQDPLNQQAIVVQRSGDGEILVKALHDGSRAVAFLNRGDVPMQLSLPKSRLDLRGPLLLRNLWTNEEREAGTAISAELQAHQVILLRVRTREVQKPATVTRIARHS